MCAAARCRQDEEDAARRRVRPHAKQKVFNAAAGLALLPVPFAGAVLAHDGDAQDQLRSAGLEPEAMLARHLLHLLILGRSCLPIPLLSPAQVPSQHFVRDLPAPAQGEEGAGGKEPRDGVQMVGRRIRRPNLRVKGAEWIE
jgi:hypothetical protein